MNKKKILGISLISAFVIALVIIILVPSGIPGVGKIETLTILPEIQVQYKDGSIKTFTSGTSSLGQVSLFPLKWLDPAGKEVDHFRFRATLNIVGSNLASGSVYRVDPVTALMEKAALNTAGNVIFNYDPGRPPAIRTGMNWPVDSAGSVNRKMYLITSFEYTTIGDYTDANINTDGANYGWTWFAQPPAEITQDDQALRYKVIWNIKVTATGTDGKPVERTEGVTSEIKFIYKRDGGSGGSLTVTITPNIESLSWWNVRIPVGPNKELVLNWLLLVLPIAGIGLIAYTYAKEKD